MLQSSHSFALPTSVFKPNLLCIALNEHDELTNKQTFTVGYVSTAQTITLYTPHTQNTVELNINRNITCITSYNNIVYIGSNNTLQAYNPLRNTDIYYIECNDGVVCNTVNNNNLCIVGGNCSISGYDNTGKEILWSVAADTVTAIATNNTNNVYNNSSKNNTSSKQLIVCTSDNYIRIFEDDNIISEILETDYVIQILTVDNSINHFVALLNNGNIVAYNNNIKVYDITHNNKATTIQLYDINNDGLLELCIGYNNGLIEFRHLDNNNSIVYSNSTQFYTTISGILVLSKDQLLICSSDGQCKLYSYITHNKTLSTDIILPVIDTHALEAQRLHLLQQRSSLQNELKQYQEQLKKLNDTINNNQDKQQSDNNNLLIPSDTTITVNVKPNKINQCVMLTLNTNNDTVIKLAICNNKLLFDNGTKTVYPHRQSSTLSIPIRSNKYINTDIDILCVVGRRTGHTDHVFNITYNLPRFSSFICVKPRDLQASGCVSFNTNERVNRVALWLNTVFNIDDKSPNTNGTQYTLSSDMLHAGFVNVRDSTHAVVIKMHNNTIHIKSDNIELCGDILQDLCSYLRIEYVQTTIDFPRQLDELNKVIDNIHTYNTQRHKMMTDIADASNVLKYTLIKAEDYRLLRDINNMSIQYSNLHHSNNELIAEYNKRSNNHNELLKSLKHVNNMIQHASRLRLGDQQNVLIQSCRQAIKNNMTHSIIDIIKGTKTVTV